MYNLAEQEEKRCFYLFGDCLGLLRAKPDKKKSLTLNKLEQTRTIKNKINVYRCSCA